MAKCDCYYQHGMKFLCYGTKEMEECSCGGDTNKCNFYPEKRKPKKAVTRLIDIGKRMEEWNELCKIHFPNMPLQPLHLFLLKAPTVYAVEPAHGEWEFGELGPVGAEVKCTNCGWGCENVDPVLWIDYPGHRFCGACGAKMDGGEDHG